MPFILDLISKEITKIYAIPKDEWISATFHVKSLVNDHHDIEWEDFPATGIINKDQTLLIVKDHLTAFTVEYYIRGDGILQWS
jgi:hypothetical protein